MIKLLSEKPHVFEIRNLLSEEKLGTLLGELTDRHWLASKSIEVRMDSTGTSFELSASESPVLGEICTEVKTLFNLVNAESKSIRIRNYGVSDGHPLHYDHYQVANDKLILTALFYLNTPKAGGETQFYRAGDPLKIEAEANKLVAWPNYLPDGSEDHSTEHESLPIICGRKVVAIFLFYGPAIELSAILQSHRQLKLDEKGN